MTTPLKLVIFDIDGTLSDSQDQIVASMRAAFEGLGLAPPSRRRSLSIVGLSLNEAMADLAPELPVQDRDRLVSIYRRENHAYRERTGAPPLFDGAAEVVHALDDAGYILSAATGKSRVGLNRFLSEHAFGTRFLGTQTADDAPSKPHPGMVLQSMAAIGADPGHTVVIGDTEFDMAMARSAGAHALGVGWGNHEPDRVRRGGAAHVADHPADLPALVESLLGPA